CRSSCKLVVVGAVHQVLQDITFMTFNKDLMNFVSQSCFFTLKWGFLFSPVMMKGGRCVDC
ncbi:MAG: hypothetical protein ACRC7H_04765, partial [Plesiomonas shigelloides]